MHVAVASPPTPRYDLTGASNTAIPAGTHDIRIFKATEADWNGGSPVPNYVTFYGLRTSSQAQASERAMCMCVCVCARARVRQGIFK